MGCWGRWGRWGPLGVPAFPGRLAAALDHGRKLSTKNGPPNITGDPLLVAEVKFKRGAIRLGGLVDWP